MPSQDDSDVAQMPWFVGGAGNWLLGLREPDDEAAALKIAKTYQNRIDTIYIGNSHGSGQQFLEKLAKASGGIGVKNFSAAQLEVTVKGLLAA